jgi:hypothetical protein
MSDDTDDKLWRNSMADKTYRLDTPTAVIGELAKQMQKKYADQALQIFRPILI